MFSNSKIVLLAILLIVTSKIFPQLSYNFSTEHEYNDNPFRSPVATKTFVSSLDYTVGFDSDLISTSYNGSYYNFSSAPERNFYWHQFSAWKNYDSSTAGIIAEQRYGKDIYTYFNYTNVTAYYNTQFNPGVFHIALSPNVSYSKYTNISILDNLKATLNGSINHGFETGTTFILGGALTYKKYLDPTQKGTYSYLDANNQLVTETYMDKNVSSISQMLSFFRVAQSITPTTGLAAQYTNRSILSGFGNFVKDLNMIYGDESEIFDDPVNYEGNNYSLEFTQILFTDLTIKGSFYFNNKFYPSQGIYDEAGNYNTGVMRRDEQKIIQLSIDKDFSLDESGSLNLSVGLHFQSINNQSNSNMFNYSNNSLGVSIGFGF